MSIDKIIVAITGLVGIVFTYWFFLMKKDNVVQATGSVTITVEGGYDPASISILTGKTTEITFLRKDESSCLEEVVIPDFKIRKHLPLGKKVALTLTPQRAGTFNYSCGMNMYHGKILVT